MQVVSLLSDKSKKNKEKVESISKWLLKGSLSIKELINYASKCKDSDKATCIEALEWATKSRPNIADENLLKFVCKTLTDEAPRTKWESARVIANIASIFPTKLSQSIHNLLVNTEHQGTVVRWATATALSEILLLNTKHNKDLLPAIENICTIEKENGVRKKYMDAIKKVQKLKTS